MEVSSQLHAPPATSPRKDFWVPTEEMWVDQKAGMGILEKRKISCMCQDSNSRSSSPLVSTRAYGRITKSVSFRFT